MRLYVAVGLLTLAVVGIIVGIIASQAGKVQIIEVSNEPLEPLDCETGLVYNAENHVCVKECPQFAIYDFSLGDCTYPYNNQYPELTSTNECNGEKINGITISEYFKTLQYFDPRTCRKEVNIQSFDFKYPVDRGFRYVYADEMKTDAWKSAMSNYFSLVSAQPHAFINGYTSSGKSVVSDCGAKSNIAKMIVTQSCYPLE